MSTSNFSYPHPILGNFDDIVPSLDENCVISRYAKDSDYHYFDFELQINDETILDLIDKKKAKYAIHYKCSTTRYEGSYSDFKNELTLKIPRKNAIVQLKVDIYVIATETFVYKNPAANPVFMDFAFDILPNDPLVIFPSRTYKLDETYLTLKHYTSILIPVSDEGLKGNEISVEIDELIKVGFSPEAFEKFKAANASGNNTIEIITSFVQTGLMTALFQLFRESESVEDIINNDKAWVQGIRTRILNEPNMPLLNEVFEDPYDKIPLLVQKLLQYPMGALLDKLTENSETGNQDKNTTE